MNFTSAIRAKSCCKPLVLKIGPQGTVRGVPTSSWSPKRADLLLACAHALRSTAQRPLSPRRVLGTFNQMQEDSVGQKKVIDQPSRTMKARFKWLQKKGYCFSFMGATGVYGAFKVPWALKGRFWAPYAPAPPRWGRSQKPFGPSRPVVLLLLFSEFWPTRTGPGLGPNDI